MTTEEAYRQMQTDLQYGPLIADPLKYIDWCDYSKGSPIMNCKRFDELLKDCDFHSLLSLVLVRWRKESMYYDGSGDEMWVTGLGGMSDMVSIVYHPAECTLSFSEIKEESGSSFSVYCSTWEQVERIRMQVAIGRYFYYKNHTK